MISCIFNGRPFMFDETRAYYDFEVPDGKPTVMRRDAALLIGKLAQVEAEMGKPCWNVAFREAFQIWSRWVHEAPRKRYYRDLIRQGVTVASAEYFFPNDAGGQLIDGLENWGRLCVRVLEQFGEVGVGPIQHDDPIRPTSIAEILRTKP